MFPSLREVVRNIGAACGVMLFSDAGPIDSKNRAADSITSQAAALAANRMRAARDALADAVKKKRHFRSTC